MSSLSVRRAPHGVAYAALATTEILLGVTAAHTWAGGSLPSAWGLLVLALVVLGSTLLLLGDRVGLRTVVPVVVGAQVGLHTLFEVSAPAAGHAAGHAALHAGHAGHAVAADGSGHLTWQMLLAHVVGTVITVLVWELRRRSVEVLLSLAELRQVSLPGRPRFQSVEAAAPNNSLYWLTGSPRRGPPGRPLCA